MAEERSYETKENGKVSKANKNPKEKREKLKKTN